MFDFRKALDLIDDTIFAMELLRVRNFSQGLRKALPPQATARASVATKELITFYTTCVRPASVQLNERSRIKHFRFNIFHIIQVVKNEAELQSPVWLNRKKYING